MALAASIALGCEGGAGAVAIDAGTVGAPDAAQDAGRDAWVEPGPRACAMEPVLAGVSRHPTAATDRDALLAIDGRYVVAWSYGFDHGYVVEDAGAFFQVLDHRGMRLGEPRALPTRAYQLFALGEQLVAVHSDGVQRYDLEGTPLGPRIAWPTGYVLAEAFGSVLDGAWARLDGTRLRVAVNHEAQPVAVAQIDVMDGVTQLLPLDASYDDELGGLGRDSMLIVRDTAVFEQFALDAGATTGSIGWPSEMSVRLRPEWSDHDGAWWALGAPAGGPVHLLRMRPGEAAVSAAFRTSTGPFWSMSGNADTVVIGGGAGVDDSWIYAVDRDTLEPSPGRSFPGTRGTPRIVWDPVTRTFAALFARLGEDNDIDLMLACDVTAR